MVRELKAFIARHQMIAPGDRVAVAVSGGADSVCLLRLLLALRDEIGFVLPVAHFDHRLRTDSAEDAKFVAQLAEKHGCAFQLASGDVRAHAAQHKQSIETAARDMRYAFFRQLLDAGTANKIATAHTRDDQAETVVMKLLRGAGTKGLSGIHPVRDQIVRPLLFASRTQIETHLHAIGQAWRDDVTNADTIHTRNRVRHDLMPLLRAFNPELDSALASTADVMRGEDEFSEAEAERALASVLLRGAPVRGGGRATTNADASALSIDALARYPLALQRRIVRLMIARSGLSATLAETDRVLALAGVLPGENAATNKWVPIRNGIRVRRLFRELQFDQEGATDETSDSESRIFEFHGEAIEQELAGTRLRLSAAPIRATQSQGALELSLPLTCTLRVWQAGDRFWMPHTRAPKKVKELLQALKLAPEERAKWPVVVCGGEIVWVKGLAPRCVNLTEGTMLAIAEIVLE